MALDDREPIDRGRLNAWLSANVPQYTGPFSLARFTGGQSNPTYRLTSASGEYVLRSKPLGNLLPSAHAVDREYRVLAALASTSVPDGAGPRVLLGYSRNR